MLAQNRNFFFSDDLPIFSFWNLCWNHFFGGEEAKARPKPDTRKIPTFPLRSWRHVSGAGHFCCVFLPGPKNGPSVNHVSVFCGRKRCMVFEKVYRNWWNWWFLFKTNPFIMSSLELPLIIKPLDTFSGILPWKKTHCYEKKGIIWRSIISPMFVRFLFYKTFGFSIWWLDTFQALNMLVQKKVMALFPCDYVNPYRGCGVVWRFENNKCKTKALLDVEKTRLQKWWT